MQVSAKCCISLLKGTHQRHSSYLDLPNSSQSPCTSTSTSTFNTKLDARMQWEKISGQIRSTASLIKQLKRSGLVEQILFTVYKSLVLSHLRYSAILLDTCTEEIKADMQVIQNRMLRIIGIDRVTALNKYSIRDVLNIQQVLVVKPKSVIPARL